MMRFCLAALVIVTVGTFAAATHGQCEGPCAGDLNGDGRVTIEELVVVVANALHGCPPESSPTSTASPTPTVTATEISTATPTSTPTPVAAQPGFPIALGTCGCATPGCLPRLWEVPAANSAWTVFTTGLAHDPADVIAFLPEQCGGTRSAPIVTLGARIGVNNQFTTEEQHLILDAIQCMVSSGFLVLGETTFKVPIAFCPSGTFQESVEVACFEEVAIDVISAAGIEVHRLSDECSEVFPDLGVW
jgi:hypothetical protein